MTAGPSALPLNRPAADVARTAPLSDEAKALLRPQQTVKQFLDALTAKGEYQQAGLVLAHVLPKREAVWWACLCARQTLAADAPPPARAALAAAERWVTAPSDETRRAAQPAADAAGVGTPAGCAALAAYLSGGSLAPAGMTEVPPADHLTATAVAGAVTLAAVLREPHKAAERHQKFVALGVDVANGRNRWPEAATRSPAVSQLVR